MSTPPKSPYGYLPAKLGGEGMWHRQTGDLLWLGLPSETWVLCELGSHPFCTNDYYTRKIEHGDGYEIVREDEVSEHKEFRGGRPAGWEYTCDGIEWFKVYTGLQTIQYNAIRRRASRDERQEMKITQNIPKSPYGYLPAKLGGEGIGKKLATDLVFSFSKQGWIPVTPDNRYDIDAWYCRPIKMDDGWESVGEDEVPEHLKSDYTHDGINWETVYNAAGYTVRIICSNKMNIPVIAFRRRRKAVSEWPKYLQSDSGKVYRLHVGHKNHIEGNLWNGFQWVLSTCCADESWYIATKSCSRITPAEAADIIGKEPVFGKELAEVAKTAEQSAKNFAKAMSEAKGPLIPANWQRITPTCLPPANTLFWLTNGKEVKLIYPIIDPENVAQQHGANCYWMPCEGSYQIPPAPGEDMDDGFEKWLQNEIGQISVDQMPQWVLEKMSSAYRAGKAEQAAMKGKL